MRRDSGSRDSDRSSSSGSTWSGGGGTVYTPPEPQAPAWTGGAVRRIPPSERADGESVSTVSRGRSAPDAVPTQDDRGRDLGRAVRRDSLPDYQNTARIRETWRDAEYHHHRERDRGRYYWHDYRGRRYSHYVDHDGYDWYLWYFDDDYYYTRYYGGRHWRYDPVRGRWCYLYDDYWIYQDNVNIYLYSGDRYHRYEETGGAVVLKPEAPTDPNAPSDDVRARYSSTDQSRMVLVKKNGNAFLYYGAGGSYFSGQFLTDRVVEVSFEYKQGGSLRRIVVNRTDGSKKFELDGKAAQPLIDPMINLQVGGLFPVKGDARGVDDVINRNGEFLKLDQSQLNGTSVGVEGLVGVGKYVEFGAGIQHGKGTADTNYKDFTRPDGKEIQQQITLGQTQTAFTARVVPFGRDKKVQPYFGAGVAVNKWSYTEKGDYIDFAKNGWPVYNETYSAKGSITTPVVLGGIRVPVNDRVSINGEYRYNGRKDVPLNPSQGFAGNTLKVGGSTVQAGVTIRLKK
ncbi:MAG: hypothetical protein HY553_22220 [Elusimicrobia bacterium]|nr:hypothetical protein [Elusimicrobiota bacterium]